MRLFFVIPRCHYKFERMYSIKVRKCRKWPSTSCTSLVPYGTNLGSTINMGRLAINTINISALQHLFNNSWYIIIRWLARKRKYKC